MAHREVGGAVAAEHDDREWNRWPLPDQQFQSPTNYHACQCADPEFRSVRERQTGAADPAIEAAAQKDKFDPPGKTGGDRESSRAESRIDAECARQGKREQVAENR